LIVLGCGLLVLVDAPRRLVQHITHPGSEARQRRHAAAEQAQAPQAPVQPGTPRPAPPHGAAPVPPQPLAAPRDRSPDGLWVAPQPERR